MKAGNRKIYDFKSVGFNKENTQTVEERAAFRAVNPIGIITPVQLGNDGDGIFAMHKNLLDQIKDNLKMLLRTNHGERLGLYDFGANLLPIAFNISTDTGDTDAMRRIIEAVSKYLPLIVPTQFEPSVIYEEKENSIAKIGIRMKYDIPVLGVTDQGVDVIIYAGG
jgi:phage baseplate assembly protein W